MRKDQFSSMFGLVNLIWNIEENLMCSYFPVFPGSAFTPSHILSFTTMPSPTQPDQLQLASPSPTYSRSAQIESCAVNPSGSLEQGQ